MQDLIADTYIQSLKALLLMTILLVCAIAGWRPMNYSKGLINACFEDIAGSKNYVDYYQQSVNFDSKWNTVTWITSTTIIINEQLLSPKRKFWAPKEEFGSKTQQSSYYLFGLLNPTSIILKSVKSRVYCVYIYIEREKKTYWFLSRCASARNIFHGPHWCAHSLWC